eukprot:g7405.t1
MAGHCAHCCLYNFCLAKKRIIIFSNRRRQGQEEDFRREEITCTTGCSGCSGKNRVKTISLMASPGKRRLPPFLSQLTDAALPACAPAAKKRRQTQSAAESGHQADAVPPPLPAGDAAAASPAAASSSGRAATNGRRKPTARDRLQCAAKLAKILVTATAAKAKTAKKTTTTTITKTTTTTMTTTTTKTTPTTTAGKKQLTGRAAAAGASASPSRQFPAKGRAPHTGTESRSVRRNTRQRKEVCYKEDLSDSEAEEEAEEGQKQEVGWGRSVAVPRKRRANSSEDEAYVPEQGEEALDEEEEAAEASEDEDWEELRGAGTEVKRQPKRSSLPPCAYGMRCYRKNPTHFAQFLHPPQHPTARSFALPSSTSSRPSGSQHHSGSLFSPSSPSSSSSTSASSSSSSSSPSWPASLSSSLSSSSSSSSSLSSSSSSACKEDDAWASWAYDELDAESQPQHTPEPPVEPPHGGSRARAQDAVGHDRSQMLLASFFKDLECAVHESLTKEQSKYVHRYFRAFDGEVVARPGGATTHIILSKATAQSPQIKVLAAAAAFAALVCMHQVLMLCSLWTSFVERLRVLALRSES